MKRTWIVHVGMGIGHELNNTISDSEFYGPFTQKQAERIETELNSMFRDEDDDEEGQTAHAMPLEEMSPDEVLRHYKIEPAS